jgi:exodeoxyribonuclease VII large subunit
MSSIITVSQLNRYISFKMKEDSNLRFKLVRGEISNFTNHAKTGHFYFTLKDRESSIKAIMFSSFAARLNFIPQNGMSVIVSASVQVFERDGIYQLYVTDMQPDGIGALYLAFEQLKEKLSAEGIFDEEHKKPLPLYPSKIGIVTSPDGAALQDILNILSRRYPIAEAAIFPALVQGENAPDSICRALDLADRSNCDIIIVGRGGGSLEDLMCFNSEQVARKLYSCRTPVISAVGHETDVTIADFAADLRAPTPSAAAELAVPEISMLYKELNLQCDRISKAFFDCIKAKTDILILKENELNKISPANKLSIYKIKTESSEEQLKKAVKNLLLKKEAVLNEKILLLDSLSPLKTMSRGYSLVYSNGRLVSSVKQVKNGDELCVHFSDGEINAVAKE